MINSHDILKAVNMIDSENLDVYTIVMGISLLDCMDFDQKTVCDEVYDKICRYANNLAKIGGGVSKDYGISIINKRISATPISMIAAACPPKSPAHFAQTLNHAAKEVGVNSTGGYSALVHKGFGPGDYALIESTPKVPGTTSFACSSVNIGTTKAGINVNTVGKMGRVVRECAGKTTGHDCIGTAKLVVFCNASEDNPSMAGTSHGPGEPDCVIDVDVSNPGVVRTALAKTGDCDITGITDLIRKTAFKITRMGQLVTQEASCRLFAPFGTANLSLAPIPTVGDFVAHILEETGLEACGVHGMTVASALLNGAAKEGDIIASFHVGGLSDALVPVAGDTGMVEAVRRGSLTLNKLKVMAAVCSVDLDMIAIPGDTSAEVISGIITDEAAIGMVNSKTAAVRLTPAIGKQAGEKLNFSGLLDGGPVMEANRHSP